MILDTLKKLFNLITGLKAKVPLVSDRQILLKLYFS